MVLVFKMGGLDTEICEGILPKKKKKKFVKGNDLYDRFEFGTFYSLSAFPKA